MPIIMMDTMYLIMLLLMMSGDRLTIGPCLCRITLTAIAIALQEVRLGNRTSPLHLLHLLLLLVLLLGRKSKPLLPAGRTLLRQHQRNLQKMPWHMPQTIQLTPCQPAQRRKLLQQELLLLTQI